MTGQNTSAAGWFKAIRGDDAMELIKANPNAFALLYVIAFRAQRTACFNRFNLKPGEALIGDFRACGMSEREYRTAKEQLTKWHFATFKATNSGTIATLADMRVFDVNLDPSDGRKDEQPSDHRRPSDGQPTTTKKSKNAKNANNETGKDPARKLAATLQRFPGSVAEAVEYGQRKSITEKRVHLWLYRTNGQAWCLDGEPIKNWKAALLGFSSECENSGDGSAPKKWVPKIIRPE